MLETIREYAVELLEASGEAETVRLRHCEHILARVEEGAAAWLTGADPHLSLFPILDEEHANFRAALTWAGGPVKRSWRCGSPAQRAGGGSCRAT